jgi:hypothetical protein
MGTGFFGKVLDPIGAIAAAHPNSFLGRAAAAGPLAGTGFQKTLNPLAYQAQAERNAQFQTPANTVQAGAFAGKDPSLAAAQAGYATPSVGVANGGPGSANSFSPGTAPWVNAAPGGTNFFNAPAGAGAPAGASPAAYVQAAGRTASQGPQSYGSGGY